MAQLKYLDLEGVESLINQTIDRIEKEAEDTLNFVDSQKGVANGIAGLDSSKKVLSTNLPIAGTSLGAIKNGYSSSGKNYAVVVNTDGTAYVNVPWESTVITAATDSVIGGFLTGYQESGRNFAVKLDDNKAYVTVPQTSLTDLGITVTASNLNNVDITSSLTSLLNGKLSTSATAASAAKLNTNAGSANQPVYFANGVPVALNYTIQTSVPANAKFTDTTYSNATSSKAGLMSQTDKAKLDTMDSDIQNQVDGKAASNATFYVGTTQIALGRASAAQTLSGVNISGNAATATKLSSAGSVSLTGDVTAAAVTYTNGGNVTLNTTITVYKDYISHKFTEATSSYTIPSLSSYHNPDVEVFFNGFLLRPTIDGVAGEYTLDSGTGVITFTNTLGGTGAEQELIIVIRSFRALPARVATPVITVVN